MSSLALSAPPDLQSHLDAVSVALDRFRLDHRAKSGLREEVRGLARALAALRKQDKDHAQLAAIQEFARCLWTAGYLAQPATEDDLALASELVVTGWGGLQAAMMLVPCWQWRDAPDLDDVPDWLWPHFIDWVFVAPCAATAKGAADLHLSVLERLAEAIARWAGRNLGSIRVREAVTAFDKNKAVLSPQRSTRSLKRWAVAQASIFSKALRQASAAVAAPEPWSRHGRSLTIGVIVRDPGESSGIRGLLPRLLGLDAERYQVKLFSETMRGDGLEEFVAQRVSRSRILPSAFADRMQMLQAANLDVLVFTGGLAGACERQLALTRLAPLQVVMDECPFASGLPNIDLHLSGLTDYHAEFSEKLAALPSPGFVWDGTTASATLEPMSREGLGLPADGVVLASAVGLEHLSPELFSAWRRILEADPHASLLLLPPAGVDTFALEQIFHRFQAESGIADARFAVSVGDPRAALKVADVYLDSYPCSCPTSVICALDAGLPVVTWRGETHRANLGSEVLRSLDLSAWVAANEDDFVQLAGRLGSDAAVRAEVLAQIRTAAKARRGFGDAPLESEAFGTILATAYDLLVEGRTLPRVLRLPQPEDAVGTLEQDAEAALTRRDSAAALALAGAMLCRDRHSRAARSLMGRAYLQSGRTAQAVPCLMSALQSETQEAGDWLSLAEALRAESAMGPAITAYQQALKLNPQRIDGWIAIAELARSAGANSLADDALTVARQIDANDPRLFVLSA